MILPLFCLYDSDWEEKVRKQVEEKKAEEENRIQEELLKKQKQEEAEERKLYERLKQKYENQ